MDEDIGPTELNTTKVSSTQFFYRASSVTWAVTAAFLHGPCWLPVACFLNAATLSVMQASHLVKVHKDKLTVTYNGKANHNHDVGAVQANRPFAHHVLIGYFEMTVVSQGERACMSIGLANSSFNSIRHPGWEPGSYGYHGEDGRKFHNSSRGEPYAVKYGAVDDVVGCGMARAAACQLALPNCSVVSFMG